MKIRKRSGELVEYNPNKIRKTLKRAGAKKEMIEQILEQVDRYTRDGITTRELYRVVKRELKKEARHIAHRYNLRSSLIRLGPAGYKFEKFIASILRAYQYDAENPRNELRGLCVRHEIDVIARKDSKTTMIEAKFRNKFGDSVNLKDTMATWARYLDLLDAAKTNLCEHFDEVWIVTNGRFSDRAHQFGVCKGMRMVGWNSREKSLAHMVDHATLYPITVLEHLRQWELDRFAARDLMLCREVATRDPDKLAKMLNLPIQRAKRIVADCQGVVTND